MDELKSRIVEEVAIITKNRLDELTKIWGKLFEPEMIENHMRKLLDHVDDFFKDIINETQDRENMITDRIEKLNSEKNDLKRLLKEDICEVSRNVPLHTLQISIDESLKYLREKLDRRHDQIESYLIEQENICQDLGEKQRTLDVDPLPSEMEMTTFREYLDDLQCEKFRRFEKICTYRHDIQSILVSLEITKLDDYDSALVHDETIKPTTSNILKLKELHHGFERKMKLMSSHISDMRIKLQSLWKYCDVPDKEQKRFANYAIDNQTTFEKLSSEIDRCEKIKRDNIEHFISKVREEIVEFWNKTLRSQAERLLFSSFNITDFNEDLLEIHEDELRSLHSFYEQNQEIFKLYNERNDLWHHMEVLMNKESDPKRYNNRGGQLLKEEKERKMIGMKLPKIEARLIDMVNNYEMHCNKAFTADGIRIQDIIERDYETKRQEKITKSGKKIVATPARTPYRANLTGMRTPLTVEQTIINRTSQMKNTQMRLAPTPRTFNHANATSSSNASSIHSVTTANGKRKLPPMVTIPQAKRKLLSAFASPSINNNVLKPVNNNSVARPLPRKPLLNKSVGLKVYNVGSVIKRRSKSRKSMSKKRNSMMKNKIPSVVLQNTTQDLTLTSNTTSYEGFENYVVRNKCVSRSSEIQKNNNFLRVNHHGFASPLIKKQTTPSKSRTPNKNLLIGTPAASTPTNKGQLPKDLEFSMII